MPVERASRKLALMEFDQFADVAGFMDVSEEVLGSLLDDDGLVSESEERVLKSVVRWMKGGGGDAMRGEDLLRKIRFPFMSALFLIDEARDASGLCCTGGASFRVLFAEKHIVVPLVGKEAEVSRCRRADATAWKGREVGRVCRRGREAAHSRRMGVCPPCK